LAGAGPRARGGARRGSAPLISVRLLQGRRLNVPAFEAVQLLHTLEHSRRAVLNLRKREKLCAFLGDVHIANPPSPIVELVEQMPVNCLVMLKIESIVKRRPFPCCRSFLRYFKLRLTKLVFVAYAELVYQNGRTRIAVR
jgi:hypothetical protein